MIIAHEHDKKLYNSPRILYKLNQKILFNELSPDIPNIKFITEDKYLVGFIITKSGIITGEEAEQKINYDSNMLANLLSIRSNRYIAAEHVEAEFTEAEGNQRIYIDHSLIWSRKERPSNLIVKENFLKLKSSSHVKQLHLKYFAKAIIFYRESSPEYALLELFKIIEPKKDFDKYQKYKSLRNVVAHSPQYEKDTLKCFDNYYNRDDFDYFTYKRDPKDDTLTTISLDFDSPKTLRKFNEISLELIDKIKEKYKYLKI